MKSLLRLSKPYQPPSAQKANTSVSSFRSVAAVHLPRCVRRLSCLLASSRERRPRGGIIGQLFPASARLIECRLVRGSSRFRHLRTACLILRDVFIAFRNTNLFAAAGRARGGRRVGGFPRSRRGRV